MTAKQAVGIISEKTRLPISLVVVLAGVLVTVVTWAVSLEARVNNHSSMDDKRVEVMEQKIEKTWEAFHSIDKRLERIEDRMQIQRPRGE